MNLKVSKFILFVGSGRSGSTIVAKILNYNSNVLISSEVGLIKFNNLSKQIIFNKIIDQDKKKKLYSKTLSNVDKKEIKVLEKNEINIIGDKHSDQDTLNIFKDFSKLGHLKKLFGDSLVLINVFRNPYDNIVTKYLRKKVMFDKKNGFINAINQYAVEMYTVSKLKRDNIIVDVKLENLILNPVEEISLLYNSIGIKYDTNYILEISKTLFETPNITRNKYNWTEKELDMVDWIINNYEWLRGYTFE